MKRPHPAMLTIWRLYLLLPGFVAAFLSALFFQPRSVPWLLVTGLWVAGFLFMYFFYLPAKYHRLSYTIAEGQLVKHSGVFYRRVLRMPLRSVRYTSLYMNPLGSFWKIGSVLVVAAGGRMMLPGLRLEEIESLNRALFPSSQAR
ncbi:PH domain-containing protein [Oscillospiraceae bacterium MB08-C2-2]|nr:PH domain-containing protein [Oscillospiraceae bacterium MB08-C2-2]